MGALITDCIKVGANAWRYAWSGTAPFTVYRGGLAMLQDSDDTELVVQWLDGAPHVEPPPIEVIDSTQTEADVQQALYVPNITLQFRGAPTNLYYKVEFYYGGDWIQAAVINETGAGYYTMVSAGLPPDTYQFRVTPYDMSGTAGEPLQYSVFHVTNPAPPELTYTYNAGTGLVTVDAA